MGGGGGGVGGGIDAALGENIHPSCTIISVGVFVLLGRSETIPGIPEMGENPLYNQRNFWRSFRKLLMASFDSVVVPVSAPLVRRCLSGQPGRG